MQKMHNYIIPLIVAFMLASCGGGQKRETKSATVSDTLKRPVHAHGAESPASVQRVRIKDDGLNAVYQQYQHLTSALTEGKLAKAKIAANALQAGATHVHGSKQLSYIAARIVEAPSIEKQRILFAILSNTMIELSRKAGVEGELYVDYCPMALDYKGAYWLTSKKEICNPYYGEKMLTCGEVKEKI